MGLSFFLWAMAVFDKKQFGLCGKTIASLRRNLLTELLPYLQGLGFLCREKRSENLLTVRFQGRENRFLLFGGRDESSAALIQGSTLAGVLLDETRYAVDYQIFAENLMPEITVLERGDLG